MSVANGVAPEPFSERCAVFAASLARSHAAYELPAAVSRPVNRIVRMSAYRMEIGPAPSWLCEIGIMPLRLTRPTVGLMPARPFADEGQRSSGF